MKDPNFWTSRVLTVFFLVVSNILLWFVVIIIRSIVLKNFYPSTTLLCHRPCRFRKMHSTSQLLLVVDLIVAVCLPFAFGSSSGRLGWLAIERMRLLWLHLLQFIQRNIVYRVWLRRFVTSRGDQAVPTSLYTNAPKWCQYRVRS